MPTKWIRDDPSRLIIGERYPKDRRPRLNWSPSEGGRGGPLESCIMIQYKWSSNRCTGNKLKREMYVLVAAIAKPRNAAFEQITAYTRWRSLPPPVSIFILSTLSRGVSSKWYPRARKDRGRDTTKGIAVLHAFTFAPSRGISPAGGSLWVNGRSTRFRLFFARCDDKESDLIVI